METLTDTVLETTTDGDRDNGGNGDNGSSSSNSDNIGCDDKMVMTTEEMET